MAWMNPGILYRSSTLPTHLYYCSIIRSICVFPSHIRHSSDIFRSQGSKQETVQSSSINIHQVIREQCLLVRPINAHLFNACSTNDNESVSEDVKSNIESSNIKTANGVSLDENQRTLVGSILDVGLRSVRKMNPTKEVTSFLLADRH